MPCSLCGETGHNKVTCGGPSSADKQETRRVNAYRKWKEDWREDFYAAEEIDDRDQLFAAGRYMVSQPPATRYAVAEEQFTQELTHDITASNFAEHCDRNIQYSPAWSGGWRPAGWTAITSPPSDAALEHWNAEAPDPHFCTPRIVKGVELRSPWFLRGEMLMQRKYGASLWSAARTGAMSHPAGMRTAFKTSPAGELAADALAAATGRPSFSYKETLAL